MDVQKVAEMKVKLILAFQPYFDTPDTLLAYCSNLFKELGLPGN